MALLRLVSGNNKLTGGTKPALLAHVILGLVPKIFWQQVSNLVNKFALLFKRSMFTEDSRDKLENDGCWRRWFSAFCKSVKYPSPEALASTSPSGGEVSFGRSMIEMLGVLAIIAVLSVGGIAGYSKAMEMWKISKQKEQLAEIFLQFVNLKDDFLREYNNTQKSVPIVAIMEAMNVIPDGMRKISNNSLIDYGNNRLSLTLSLSTWKLPDGGVGKALEYYMEFDIYQAEKSNSVKQRYCVTFLEQLQAVSPYIMLVQNRSYNNSLNYSENRLDIKSAKPHELHNFCKTCNAEQRCVLITFFKL